MSRTGRLDSMPRSLVLQITRHVANTSEVQCMKASPGSAPSTLRTPRGRQGPAEDARPLPVAEGDAYRNSPDGTGGGGGAKYC